MLRSAPRSKPVTDKATELHCLVRLGKRYFCTQGLPRPPEELGKACPGARQNLAWPAQGRPRSAEKAKKAAQAAEQGHHNCHLLERFGQLRETIQ